MIARISAEAEANTGSIGMRIVPDNPERVESLVRPLRAQCMRPDSRSEIEVFDLGGAFKLIRGTLERNTAGFDHVSSVGHA